VSDRGANQLLTVADVARRLRVSGDHVLALIHSGRLQAINVGLGRRPRWRITAVALDLFIAARTAPARASRTRKVRAANVTEFF
jgi:excisionase family DNA binding protein